MATGIATVDFGAFPGSSHTVTTITGQAGIVSGSLVEAWLMPRDTVDHLADEHVVESIKVVAGAPVVGVGFDIHALNTSPLFEPLQFTGVDTFRPAASSVYGGPAQTVGGRGTMLYGLWTVGWVWQ